MDKVMSNGGKDVFRLTRHLNDTVNEKLSASWRENVFKI